jgi:hypothetical protein
MTFKIPYILCMYLKKLSTTRFIKIQHYQRSTVAFCVMHTAEQIEATNPETTDNKNLIKVITKHD